MFRGNAFVVMVRLFFLSGILQRSSAFRFRIFSGVLRVLPVRLPGCFATHIGRDRSDRRVEYFIGDRESDLEPTKEEWGVQPVKALRFVLGFRGEAAESTD